MNKQLLVFLVTLLLAWFIPSRLTAQVTVEIADNIWVDVTPCDSISEMKNNGLKIEKSYE